MTGRSHDARPSIALVAHEVHDNGGMERVCAELVRRASDQYRFTIVAARVDSELLAIADWIPVRVPPRPIPLRMVAFAAVAGWKLRRVHAELVHTVGAVVPNQCDLATVHMSHAGVRDALGLAPGASTVPRRLNTGLARSLAIAAERWCYRPGRVRTLAAVSQGVADELRRHHPAVPVTVTPNGVDTERFQPDAEARAMLRRQHGLGPDDLVALFVGGDWPHKGLDVAVRAIACEERDRWRLWILGEGDVERYMRLASTLGVAERIEFFGYREETECFYPAADVVLLPSGYEAFPLVGLEALAAGVPLVAPLLNGVDELIGDGKAGMVVEPTAESISTSLLRLASDATLRNRLRSEARKRALGFSWYQSVESAVRIYEDLISSGADVY